MITEEDVKKIADEQLQDNIIKAYKQGFKDGEKQLLVAIIESLQTLLKDLKEEINNDSVCWF